MSSLIIASILWAFSFGLIKGQLTEYDPVLVAALRLGIAAVVFMPWLRKGPRHLKTRWRLAALGALQFGLMYWLYISSYRTLPGYAVALLTILTPIYIAIIRAALDRRWDGRALVAALVAVVGAGVLKWGVLPGAEALTGVLMVQGANLSFALGQVLYARWQQAGIVGETDAGALAWMYVGAMALVASGLLLQGVDLSGSWSRESVLTVVYLGVMPTAVGFWLWNRGVARVSGGTAAVMNNLKIPLAMVAAWTVFGESVNLMRLGPGLVLIVGAAIWISRPSGGAFSRGQKAL